MNVAVFLEHVAAALHALTALLYNSIFLASSAIPEPGLRYVPLGTELPIHQQISSHKLPLL